MENNYQKKLIYRIVSLILLVVVIGYLGMMRAFSFQVVRGAEFFSQTSRTYESTSIIYATRGEIVDRNGVLLVTNKTVFNVELDYNFLSTSNQNDMILSVIEILEQNGEDWNDNIPITRTKPYAFMEGTGITETQLKALLGVNSYATAQDCMTQIYMQMGIYSYDNGNGRCTHCGEELEFCTITEYTEEQARSIASVRMGMLSYQFSRLNNRYILAEDISSDVVAVIRELSSELSGVEIGQRTEREYLTGDIGSHLIGGMGPIFAENLNDYLSKGYLRNDTVGISGLELAMEDSLRGQNGQMLVVKDSSGNIVQYEETTSPVAGNTVMLSLDIVFQERVQEIVKEYVDNYNEANLDEREITGGAVVVLDSYGKALAIVSYPYYDIGISEQELLSMDNSPAFNRALQGTYRPGSTFKPIVAAAGLSEDIIEYNQGIYCSGTYDYWTGYSFGCLSVNHGRQVLGTSEALTHSCNIFFYDLGRQMGIDTMNDYANAFGLGVKTGIEIPSATGILSSPEVSELNDQRWEAGNVVQAAIGQMDTAITPISMAVEAMTLGNQGLRYKTSIIDSILSYDQTEVILEVEPEIASQVVLDEEEYRVILDGMIGASQSLWGEYSLSNLEYTVALKTGTPQVSVDSFNHAFVAYAPAEAPEIAIACIMEDGYNTHYMLRDILEAYEEIVVGGR